MKTRVGMPLWAEIWHCHCFNPRFLWWRQINRYRDWIRPFALAHPRLVRLVNLVACPKCGDLQPVRDAASCDLCYHIAFQKWNAPHMREYLKQFRREGNA